MKLLERLILKLKEKAISLSLPNVKDFLEADKYCKLRNKSNYEADFLSKYRFEKLQAYLKKVNYLDSPYANMLMHSTILFFKQNQKRVPNVVDFGGACGESLIFLSSIFGEEIFKNSWIIESPSHVEISKRYDFSKNINFSSDLEGVLKNHKIDIFFSSGSIQYIKDPYKLLKIVGQNKIPIICLTRNNFSLNPSAFIQLSKLSDNGTGFHLDNYKDRTILYPATSISEKKVEEIFVSRNYQIILKKKGIQTCVLDEKNCYSNDLCFLLN